MGLLEALTEQESPINTATFKPCKNNQLPKNVSLNEKQPHNTAQCELENSIDVNAYSSTATLVRNNSEKDAYNDTQGCICIQPCICYDSGNGMIQDKHQLQQTSNQQKMEENGSENCNRLFMQSTTTPVLGPRFATVRKSLTLPHDINNMASFFFRVLCRKQIKHNFCWK